MIDKDTHRNRCKAKKLGSLILKPAPQRSDQENQELVNMLKAIPFFQKKVNLKDSNYRDLASRFKFQIGSVQENIINYGDEGDNFYIILLGIVQIMIPNP